MTVKSWMFSSLLLALLVGVGLGVIADRVLVGRAVFADAAPPKKTPPLWFICDQHGSLDVEEEPGYFYPSRLRAKLLEGLGEELGLDPEQHAEVQAFLEQRRHGAHEFWESSRHAYCDMRDGFRHELRSMLNDEQKLRFDSLMAGIDRHQADLVERIKANPQTQGARAAD